MFRTIAGPRIGCLNICLHEGIVILENLGSAEKKPMKTARRGVKSEYPWSYGGRWFQSQSHRKAVAASHHDQPCPASSMSSLELQLCCAIIV